MTEDADRQPAPSSSRQRTCTVLQQTHNQVHLLMAVNCWNRKVVHLVPPIFITIILWTRWLTCRYSKAAVVSACSIFSFLTNTASILPGVRRSISWAQGTFFGVTFPLHPKCLSYSGERGNMVLGTGFPLDLTKLQIDENQLSIHWTKTTYKNN